MSVGANLSHVALEMFQRPFVDRKRPPSWNCKEEAMASLEVDQPYDSCSWKVRWGHLSQSMMSSWAIFLRLECLRWLASG